MTNRSSDVIRTLGEDVDAFFRRLVEVSSQALLVHREGRVIYANPGALALLGATRLDQVVGRPVKDFVHPDDVSAIGERVRRIVEEGVPAPPRVDRLLSVDGRLLEVEVSGLHFPLQDGTPGVLAQLRDVTERRRAEAALRESEEKFASAFRASPLAITISRLADGSLIEVNQSFCRLTGFTRDEVIGRSGIDIGLWVDADDRHRLFASLERGEEVRDLEITLRIKGGEQRTGRLSAERVEIGGEPCMLVIADDVTAQQRAQLVQTATYRIAEAAHRVQNLDELYPAIHAIVADLMPARNFYFGLFADDRLTFPYFVDDVDERPTGPVPLGKGLTEYVLRTGEALLVNPDVFRQLIARGEIELVGPPSIDWLGVPLKVDGKTTGVLVVQSYAEGVRFGVGDLEILQFVSDQVAMAIERRRSEDSRLRREALLRTVADAISSATGDAFFRSLVLHLAAALGMSFAFVGGLASRFGRTSGGRLELDDTAVRRAARQRIETIAVAANGAIGDNFAYELSGTPCEQVVGNEVSVYSDGVAELFPDDLLLAEMGVRCYLGVPLADSSGRPLGLLVVMDNKPLADPETARALLQIFATRAAAELERAGAETALRASEERYRLFIEQSSEAIWCVELDEPMPITLSEDAQVSYLRQHGFIAECNAATAAMYGYERPEELVGVYSRDLLPSEPANEAYQRAVIRSGYRLIDAESHEVDRHGRPKVLLNNVVGVVEAGQLLRFWGTARDITERRQAEVLLEQQAAAIRASMDGMAIFDAAGRALFVNDAYAKVHGCTSAQELVGAGWETCYTPEEAARLRADVFPEVQRLGKWRGTAIGRRRQGTTFPEEVSLNRIEGGGMVAVARDTTERRFLEEQLLQAQKMEAVGRLAGGVAHDFNNLLTAITGYSDLLLARLGGEHPLRREIEEIKRAGVRAADLTRQLLAFSRRQVLSARVVSLNRVVTDIEKLLRRVIGEDIQLVTTLEPNLGSVRADAGQLEQVILNLAVNARDAMPNGGTLELRTSNLVLDAERARRFLGLRPGDYVALEVVDSGEGISAEVREHIFEPFFTTKEVGRGTGLGLSMVYGIVRQSEGHIEVDSAPGAGTVFRIFLPRVHQVAETAADFQPVRRSPSGHETILVVEDEPAVQQLVRRILEDRGYRVIVAPHGAAALGACDHANRIDLLLTDVVMPGLSGPELAEQLRARMGDLAVLFMSGYTESFVGRRGVEDGSNFLQKPFTPEALAQRVREALDARKPPAA
jgi:PAS domain S-box-containing protein